MTAFDAQHNGSILTFIHRSWFSKLVTGKFLISCQVLTIQQTSFRLGSRRLIRLIDWNYSLNVGLGYAGCSFQVIYVLFLFLAPAMSS